GAGTYSDGKLYTRSTKRGSVEEILQLLVNFGADPSILYTAHPHIGTNKLPHIIESIRKQIQSSGGEVHFNEQVCDLRLNEGRIQQLICSSGNKFEGDAIISTAFGIPARRATSTTLSTPALIPSGTYIVLTETALALSSVTSPNDLLP
ncbi:MAG: hypothetical protein EBW15_08615, partial [Actinobacteria bacterium]|nr:hypothetical protein [Actinomycetota bacterium]